MKLTLTFAQPGGAPHSFVVTFLRSCLIVFNPHNARSHQGGGEEVPQEQKQSCLQLLRPLLQALRQVPRFRFTKEVLDLVMMMITRAFRGFPPMNGSYRDVLLPPPIHYVATFLRTSLQKIRAAPTRTSPVACHTKDFHMTHCNRLKVVSLCSLCFQLFSFS